MVDYYIVYHYKLNLQLTTRPTVCDIYVNVHIYLSPSLNTYLNWAFPLNVIGITAITTMNRSLCGVARTLRWIKFVKLSFSPHTLASVDDFTISSRSQIRLVLGLNFWITDLGKYQADFLYIQCFHYAHRPLIEGIY